MEPILRYNDVFMRRPSMTVNPIFFNYPFKKDDYYLGAIQLGFPIFLFLDSLFGGNLNAAREEDIPIGRGEEEEEDESSWILAWLEAQLDKTGLGGRSCLQRLLCEALLHRQQLRERTILADVLQMLLPRNSTESFITEEGEGGASCRKTFESCPISLFGL